MIDINESESYQLRLETSTPTDTMTPIGPYSHIVKVGDFITIGGTAGIGHAATGEQAGTHIASQTTQILYAFELMLETVESDLAHINHCNTRAIHLSLINNV